MSSPNFIHASGVTEAPVPTSSSKGSDSTAQADVTTTGIIHAGLSSQPTSTASPSTASSAPAPVQKSSKDSWPGFTHVDLMKKTKRMNTPWGYHARSRDVLWELHNTYNTPRPDLPKGVAYYTAEALQYYTSVLNKTKAEHEAKIQATKKEKSKSPEGKDDMTRRQTGSSGNSNSSESSDPTPPITPVARKRSSPDNIDGLEDSHPSKKRASSSIHDQNIPIAHAVNTGHRGYVIVDSDDEDEITISQETPSKTFSAQEPPLPSSTAIPDSWAQSPKSVRRSQAPSPAPLLVAASSDIDTSSNNSKKRRLEDQDSEEPVTKKARNYRHVRPESDKENRRQQKKETTAMAKNKARDRKILAGKPVHGTKKVTSNKPKAFQVARDDAASKVEPTVSGKSKPMKASVVKDGATIETSATTDTKQGAKHTKGSLSKSSNTQESVKGPDASISPSETQTSPDTVAPKGKSKTTTAKADKRKAPTENTRPRGVAVRKGSETSRATRSATRARPPRESARKYVRI